MEGREVRFNATVTPPARVSSHMPVEYAAIVSGQLIGHYRVTGTLGQGGMGVVYRAHHDALDRDVAIKLISGLASDRAAAERFLREGRAVSRMRHPNILTVFDYGEVDSVPYLVTEYMPGGSLADKLGDGPMDEGLALRYLREVGSAIDYAHRMDTIHRDIKPSNVLIGAGGEAILADFGLAKYLSDQVQRTQSGFISGTVAYMAPEQARETAVGGAADVYSFSVMAFELLTGKLPFPGDSVLDILIAHLQEPPPPPSTVNPALGDAVDAVVLRGLAKEPENRWGSCAEMVAALEAALARGPERAAATPTVHLARAVKSSRARVWWAVGAALLLVVGALAVGSQVSSRKSPAAVALAPAAALSTPTPQAAPPTAVPLEATTPSPVQPSPTASPTAVPAVTATATPRPSPTATATPTPTPTPTLNILHSVNISGPGSCAVNVTCTMTAYPSGGSGSFSYTWTTTSTKGAGPTATGQSFAGKYAIAAQYVVTCVVKDLVNGQSVTASRDLTVS